MRRPRRRAVTAGIRLDPALDARLVERCLRGDARAWAELVDRHERLVYAVARSYRLSEEDLADVFQDVFTALARGLPRLQDPRSLCRWLSSTTDRIALATALRRRREHARTGGSDEALAELPSGDPAPGGELELLEQQAMVRLGLAALAPRCQRLLTALYYEDPTPSYDEISRRLGVPIGSLGPTRARCFQKLREWLVANAGSAAGIRTGESRTSGSEGGPRVRGARGTEEPIP